MRFATTVLFILTILTPAANAQEVWKFTTASQPPPDQILTHITLLEGVKERIEDALTLYTDIPEVRRLQEEFSGNLRVSIFLAGGGGRASSVSLSTERPSLTNLGREIALYGRDAFAHPMIQQRTAFYYPPWGAVVTAAIQWADERWFDAVMLHELYHASKHDGAPVLEQSTDWAIEEMGGHMIERLVLDIATDGQYRKRLTEVAKGLGTFSNVAEFVVKVGSDDLQKLDELFRPAAVGGLEESIRYGQYYIDLATVWVQLAYDTSEWPTRWLDAYFTVTTLREVAHSN